MSDISDEELMQFADDAGLDSARRLVIAAAVSSDRELALRLSAFQATGRRLGAGLDDLLALPLPDHLIDTIMAAPAMAPARQPLSPAVPLPPSPPSGLAGRIAGMLAELFTLRAVTAMTCALLGGVVLGAQSSGLMSGSSSAASLLTVADGRAVAHGALASALDTQSSGTTASMGFWRNSIAIKPVLSFATLNNAICRQYEIEIAGRERFNGLGCRESGRWRIEAQSAAPIPSSRSDAIRTAGAGEPSPVDRAVDHLMAGNALTVAQERAAMHSGWTLNSPAPTPQP